MKRCVFCFEDFYDSKSIKTSDSMSLFLKEEGNKATGMPSRFTKNFSKFHLILKSGPPFSSTFGKFSFKNLYTGCVFGPLTSIYSIPLKIIQKRQRNHFCKHRKRHVILLLNKIFDPWTLFRFLMTKLIARKSKNRKSLIFVLFVHFLQL